MKNTRNENGSSVSFGSIDPGKIIMRYPKRPLLGMCKETPKEVLRMVYPDYFIAQYKHVDLWNFAPDRLKCFNYKCKGIVILDPQDIFTSVGVPLGCEITWTAREILQEHEEKTKRDFEELRGRGKKPNLLSNSPERLTRDLERYNNELKNNEFWAKLNAKQKKAYLNHILLSEDIDYLKIPKDFPRMREYVYEAMGEVIEYSLGRDYLEGKISEEEGKKDSLLSPLLDIAEVVLGIPNPTGDDLRRIWKTKSLVD